MSEFSREHDLDLAIEFSLGMLDADAERAVLERAQTESEFELLLQQQCSSAETARAKLSEAMGASTAMPKRRFARRRSGRAVIGGLLAASLALVIVWQPWSSPQDYWLPADAALSVSRSGGANGQGWRSGVESYADHDLAAAIKLFESAELSGAESMLRDLYLASALLNDGQHSKAREVLEGLQIELLPHPWRGHAEEMLEICGGS